jgi:Tfp pilus assembly protein PilV
MRNSQGFTLVETLIATVVLLSGIVAVAQMFSYSAATNISTQQMTSATLLTTNKMEQLRALPFANLTTGGSLDPDAPATGFWEYVSIAADGTITADTSATTAPYMRVWTVSGTNPKTITIIVYSLRSSMGRQRMELTRASTRVTRKF